MVQNCVWCHDTTNGSVLIGVGHAEEEPPVRQGQ